MKKRFIPLLITFIIGLIYFYFVLPPLNPTAFSFWVFVALLTVTFLVLNASSKAFENVQVLIEGRVPKSVGKEEIAIISAVGTILGLILLINFFMSPIFISNKYATRIAVDDDKEFTEDVKTVDPTKLPVIDKASSMRLGDRVMGRMPDLVSQFYVSTLYTQINYNNDIVRVTPLEYSDIFKVIANRKNGIEGYIKVNSVTGEADLVRLEEGMKYMNSAIFNKNLDRSLRFSYPTKIFGAKAFEIDDDGNPYWIVPTLKYNGINIRAEVNGAIILDPITGESDFYEVDNVPEWVDHVYPSSLVLEQVNDWGTYTNGFFNSLFGQRGVVVTTQGYNYTVMNDDVYLYTGITSVISDESNIGFILTNLRTKQTSYYAAPGAEEFSAMNSAQGQVQQMNYNSTFPLLVNINNKPTYFVSLKDNAGLVKMFAFVDVADYQKVVVTDSSFGIEEAIKNYMGDEDVIVGNETNTETIEVVDITSAIISGNTFYYILDSNDNVYKVNLIVNESLLPFVKIGDSITIEYNESSTINIINSIER